MSRITFLALAATASALLAAALGAGPQPRHARAGAPSLSVPTCLEVASGQTFDLRIHVTDINDLLAWEIYYGYNREVLEIVGRDVRQVIGRSPGSNVFDFSDPLPNATGLYRLAAADTGGPQAAESGSGVLAVLTIAARARGVSWSTIYKLDFDRDGRYDLGPRLTTTGGGHIADRDGDGIFDGPIASGQIAVDTSCADPAPTPGPDSLPPAGPNAPPPGGQNQPGEGEGGGLAQPTPNLPPADPGEAEQDPTATPAGQTPDSIVARQTPGPRGTAGPAAVAGGSDPGGAGGVSAILIAAMLASSAAGLGAAYLVLRAARRAA